MKNPIGKLIHVDSKGIRREVHRILGKSYYWQNAVIKGRLRRDDIHYIDHIPVLICAHDNQHDESQVITITATLNNFIIE